jgi:molecular chaperone HscB
MDHFEFLGLPRRLSLDTAMLQQRFYELSRQHHPDRFAASDPQARAQAEHASAALNDAYRTLRDPVSRAEYLLRLEGFDSGEQRGKDVPPELLEEVFELNMALEEVRHGVDEAREPLAHARAKFFRMRDDIAEELQTLSARYDANPTREILLDIRNLLNRRRYVLNLVKEVEKALSSEVPAL